MLRPGRSACSDGYIMHELVTLSWRVTVSSCSSARKALLKPPYLNMQSARIAVQRAHRHRPLSGYRQQSSYYKIQSFIPLWTKLDMSDLNTQSVPRCKHCLPRLYVKTDKLMCYRKVVAVCSEIHTYLLTYLIHGAEPFLRS